MWPKVIPKKNLSMSLGVEDLEAAGWCEVVEDFGDDGGGFEAILPSEYFQ